MRRRAFTQLRVEPLEPRTLLDAGPPPFQLVAPAVADAFTSESKPTTNYGASKALRSSPTQSTWLKFRVDAVDATGISRVVVRIQPKGKRPVCGDLFAVPDTSWDEGTIMWTDQPEERGAPVPQRPRQRACAYEATEVVTGPGVYSFLLTSKSPAKYASREAGIQGPTISLETAAISRGAVRFVAISDYGGASQGDAHAANERSVAELVDRLLPDFVITLGDNNYRAGSQATIDSNIGQFYEQYIGNYTGRFGPGSAENRFFPALGNHDWGTPGSRPYLDYFTLPGNERYYDFVRGPVHLYAIDSDRHEPDGVTPSSVQGQWLKQQLAASTSPWNIVYFHHSPFSSGDPKPGANSSRWMRWPFRDWGADAVLSGHFHGYERVTHDGLPYLVNGLGGYKRHGIDQVVEGSQLRYNNDFGALLVDADESRIVYRFINRQYQVIDSYVLEKGGG